MTNTYHKLALCVLAGTLSMQAAADQTTEKHGIVDKSSTAIALTNANLISPTGKSINNATVLIRDGRIIDVAKGKAAPAGFKTYDLTGYNLYPGFIDPYTQYGMPKDKKEKAAAGREKPVYYNQRLGGNASNDAIKPEIDWVSKFDTKGANGKKMMKLGFTTVQSAKFDGIMRGQGFVTSTKADIPNDVIYDANTNHFLSFHKGSSKQSYPSSLMGSIALIRQTFADANWYQQAWGKQDTRYFGEKIEYNAALEAIAEMKKAGIIFETNEDQDIFRAAELLNEFGYNGTFIASGYEYTRANDLKAIKASLIVPVDFPSSPAVQTVSGELDVGLGQLRHWERAPTNPASLEDAGVPFAFTQYRLDKPEKYFWKNIRKAVKAGLSEKTALQALTTVPAKIAGVSNQVGQVKKGYMADLVISKGNLFEKGKIVAVLSQGNYVEFAGLNAKEYPGQYDLTVAGKASVLTLKKDKSSSKSKTVKYKGKLEIDGTSIKLSNIKASKLGVSFTANLTNAGINGVARFSGMHTGEALALRYQLPDGSSHDVSATKQPKPAKASKPAQDHTLVSQLTYPNIAYGLTERPTTENLHIKNATVWTSDQAGVLENTDILVSKGKFKKLGKNLKTPSGYRVIDGTGKHVTAGIIDEHSHIAIQGGVNEGTSATTSEVRIGDVVNAEDFAIYRGLAGGVTAAQLLHGSANPVGGQAQTIKLRWGERANNLKFVETPASIKFALGENVKQSNWGELFNIRYPQTRIGVDTIIRDNFQAAKEYKAQWEAWDDLSRSKKKKVAPPRKDYRLEALVEILDGDRNIHTHSYVQSEILNLIKIADDMGFKVQTFTHILEGYKAADEMVAHGAGGSTFADWWAYKFEVYDAIPGNACLMQDKGVVVSINSDSTDLQRHLNQEAAKSMVYCGMDAEDAWNMVTINPAKQLKIDHLVGSIKAGKQADFVIWNNNPLSVYAKVEQTWIDGKKYFDLDTDAAMTAAIEKEYDALVQKALLADDPADMKGSQAKRKQPVWHCEDLHGFGTDHWLEHNVIHVGSHSH